MDADTAVNAGGEGMRDHPAPGSELLTRMQRHVAQLAANGSSLRNQGAAGVVDAARQFLATLDLASFVAGDERSFAAALDRATEDLRRGFPEGARNWGAARKVLNLFLRDCLYHTYLARAYGLDRLRFWLEVPLDSQVAAALRKKAERGHLPPWPQIKRLTRETSGLYQTEATERAKTLGVARVDLDLWFWNPK